MTSMSLDNLVETEEVSFYSEEIIQQNSVDSDINKNARLNPSQTDGTSIGIPVSDTGQNKKAMVAFYVEDDADSYKELSAKEKARNELKTDRREAR